MTNAFFLQNMIFHKVQTSANALTGSSCFNNHLHIPMHMNSQSYQILTLVYLPSLLLAYIAICIFFTFCIKFYTHKKENGKQLPKYTCNHVVLPILILLHSSSWVKTFYILQVACDWILCGGGDKGSVAMSQTLSFPLCTTGSGQTRLTLY